MSDNELPTVATKDAVCHIDFEFQMPYHEPLTSKDLLEECISTATSDVLATQRTSNGQILTLEHNAIEIPEIDLRPNETNPKRIKVCGWITCSDNQRQTYMDALQLAQKSRKISKAIANKTDVKRTKITIQQFSTRFSNEHHVNKSFIDSTVKNFEVFKKRSNSLLSNPETTDENKTDTTPPLTNLYEGGSSVIVHDDVDNNNNNNNDNDNDNNSNDNNNSINEQITDEEYDIVSNVNEQSANDTNNDTSHDIDSSFQLVDELNANDQDEQSSNEEHKSVEDNFEDYTAVTPNMPTAMAPDAQEDELIKLRLEISSLKGKHADELNHFQNKVNTLKEKIKTESSARVIERQRSRISMQIDDDIIKKQIKQETDVEVEKLQSEIKLKEKQDKLNLQQIQLKHQTELQKFDYKLRQTQQLHTLEVNNIRNQHKYESEQLQSQIRGLTGALERESQKDRKIYELTEEIEILKVSKDKIISNYETAIEKLNNDSEDSIRQAIDRRIKETAAFKREVNDLKQKMQRNNNVKNRLETQLKQLQFDIESKENIISQMRDMFIKERKKAAILEKKLKKSRSKRNILNEKEDKMHKQKEEILNKGGHIRKKSKTMKNVFVKTEKNQKTGDTVITLEKTNEPFDILATMTEEELMLVDVNSDTDDDNDEHKLNEDAIMMDKDEHDQEMVLKEQEITSLKEKIKRSESEHNHIIEEKNEELRALQQKIGSLQQQIEIQDENFLKQNQMLEFKLRKKENDKKKVDEDFHDLRTSHRKEIRKFNETIDRVKSELIDKDRQVQSLETNLDMIEEENARLKENDEIIADYEHELDEIDNHYQNMLDEMKQQNEQTEIELKDLVHRRESESESLKKKVHTQTESIAELHSLLESMQNAEMELENKQQRVNQILAQKENINNGTMNNINKKKRESIELKENDLNDNLWRGQTQVDQPQPDSQPQTPTKGNNNYNGNNNVIESSHGSRQSIGNGNGIDISDYVLKEDVEQIINDKIEEEKKKLEMGHALEIDTIGGKLKQRFTQTETRLNENINKLENDKNQLINQLNENRNNINILQTQLTNAENNKLKLLDNFMREMDRMREEIKKLNQMKRNKRK